MSRRPRSGTAQRPETYCATTSSSDKVAIAIEFCRSTKDIEALRKLHSERAKEGVDEFKGIFTGIFGKGAEFKDEPTSSAPFAEEDANTGLE